MCRSGFFDPGETGNLTFGTNGQNFRVRGIETSGRGPGRARPYGSRCSIVEPERTDQFAVFDRQTIQPVPTSQAHQP